jgi:hypothetical protein
MAILLPNRDQLEAISTLRTGDLAEIPYPVLLLALAEHQASGFLEIQRRPIKKRITLVKGAPVDCRSNLAHETFGPFLVSMGRITEEQHQQLTSRSLLRGVPLGEVLLAEKVIGASDLYRLLQQNLARKLLDAFTWTSGEYTFTPDDVTAVDTTLRVRVPQLVLTGLLKLGELETSQKGLESWHDQALRLDPEFEARLVDLRLPGRYQQLVDALQAPRGLHELLLATSLSPTEVVRIVYALGLLGVVAPASRIRPPATGEIPLPVMAPAPVVVAAPAVPSFDLEAARNYVLEAYLSYKRKDAFELLGLEDGASNGDMEAAFIELARRVKAFQLEDLGEKELAEKACLLLVAAAEALGELKDVERRNALIQRRRLRREEREKRPFGESHIKTDLLDSNLQFRKGRQALEAGQYDKALQLLQFASDCDPQNALYLAEAAYCALLKDPALGANKAVRDLERAVRLDENCGLAHYYLGEAYIETTRFDDAERHLRKSIKLIAPDRRPIEALKQLTIRRAKR